MKTWLALLLAVVLAGCAKDGSFDIEASIAPTKAEIVADNFCHVAKKVTWSVTDTWQTIDEARRHNERVDKLCGIPGDKKPDPKTS